MAMCVLLTQPLQFPKRQPEPTHRAQAQCGTSPPVTQAQSHPSRLLLLRQAVNATQRAYLADITLAERPGSQAATRALQSVTGSEAWSCGYAEAVVMQHLCGGRLLSSLLDYARQQQQLRHLTWLALEQRSRQAIQWVVTRRRECFRHDALAATPSHFLQKCRSALPDLTLDCAADGKLHVVMHVARQHGVADLVHALLAEATADVHNCRVSGYCVLRTDTPSLGPSNMEAQLLKIAASCAFGRHAQPRDMFSAQPEAGDDVAEVFVSVASTLCNGLRLQCARGVMARLVDRYMDAIMTRLWRPEGRLAQRRAMCSARRT